MSKVALFTGITGQNGAYLAESLLNKGCEVHGIKRRASSFTTDRINLFYQDPNDLDRRLIVHYGDLTDSTNLVRTVQRGYPAEISNRVDSSRAGNVPGTGFQISADRLQYDPWIRGAAFIQGA